MNCMTRKRQRGATLLVGMIMLVVLTLLVVFALRSGNTNLRISGNMQAQTESTAAAQVMIEKLVEKVKTVDNIDAISLPTEIIKTGAASYSIKTEKPSCTFTRSIPNNELDPSKAVDLPCFEGSDGEKFIGADGKLTTNPSACNDQQWDLQASVEDSVTGAKVTLVQGMAVRVPGGVSCK